MVVYFRRKLGLTKFIIEVMGGGAIDKIEGRAGKKNQGQNIGGSLN